MTPGYAVSFYLPTIIVQAGFDDPVTANLMASPVWLVAAVVIIVNAWLSDRYRRRDLNIILPAAVGCIGFVLLGAGNYLDNFGLQYFAMYLACPATVCLIPITLAWMTDTVRGSTRTSVAHAMTVGPYPAGGRQQQMASAEHSPSPVTAVDGRGWCQASATSAACSVQSSTVPYRRACLWRLARGVRSTRPA